MATKITRLRVTNYRGIRSLDATIPPSGATIAKGRNGSGKTSTIKAIGAALAAVDVGADAIRVGEESGEIIIDLDKAGEALRVRRRLGKGKLTVTQNPDADYAMPIRSPTSMLAELLGEAPLDVISVVLEKDPKKRRDLILQALPMKVSVEQLRRYVPQLPDNFDTRGHALEVVGKLKGSAYDRRTAANKAAKDARAAAQRAASEAAAMRGHVAPNAPTDRNAAIAATKAANNTLAGLRARADAASRSETRTSKLREQVAKLRSQAEAAELAWKCRPAAEALTDTAANELEAEVARLVTELERVRGEAQNARNELSHARERMRIAEQEMKAGQAAAAQADELEATITEEAAECVTVFDIWAAEEAAELARQAEEDALQAAQARAQEDVAAELAKRADEAEAEAKRLDGVVHALTVDAPADILRESAGPPGLELAGDEIKLNGVSLDHLCGAEQMQFAAQIAAALAPGAGFIVVDGLERLDPEQLDAFVAAACAGGRQLFGSLVAAGELVLAHVEPASSSTEAA